MATIGKIELPIFTEINGEKIKLGEVEIPINASIHAKPGKREAVANVNVDEGAVGERIESFMSRVNFAN